MKLRYLICVSILCGGCSQRDPNAQPLIDATQGSVPTADSVWSEGPGNGSVSSMRGKQLSLTAQKCDFYSVVHHICDIYEVNCTVRPASLVDREITLNIGGSDAQSTFTELAELAGMECTQKSDKLWLLCMPNSDGESEELIRMSDY